MTRADRYRRESIAQLEKSLVYLKGAATILNKNQVRDKFKRFEVEKMVYISQLLIKNLKEDISDNWMHNNVIKPLSDEIRGTLDQHFLSSLDKPNYTDEFGNLV